MTSLSPSPALYQINKDREANSVCLPVLGLETKNTVVKSPSAVLITPIHPSLPTIIIHTIFPQGGTKQQKPTTSKKKEQQVLNLNTYFSYFLKRKRKINCNKYSVRTTARRDRENAQQIV
jgi:hypothetical protein